MQRDKYPKGHGDHIAAQAQEISRQNREKAMALLWFAALVGCVGLLWITWGILQLAGGG